MLIFMRFEVVMDVYFGMCLPVFWRSFTSVVSRGLCKRRPMGVGWGWMREQRKEERRNTRKRERERDA
jgi:hypothetical protein